LRIRLKVVRFLTQNEKGYMSWMECNGSSAYMLNPFGDKRQGSLGSSWGTETLGSFTSQRKLGDAKTIFVSLYTTGRFSLVQMISKKEPKHISQTSTLNLWLQDPRWAVQTLWSSVRTRQPGLKERLL
jgi:hypothetical protein